MSCNVVLYIFVYFCNMFDWMFLIFSELLVLHAGGTRRGGLLAGSCQDTSGEPAVIRWSVSLWLLVSSRRFHMIFMTGVPGLRRCLLCSIPFALTATCRRCATLSARRQQMLSPYVFTPVTLTTYWYLLIRLFGFCLPFHSVFCWTTRFCLKVMDAALPEGEWMRFAACSVDGRMCSLTSQAETW